MNRKFKQKRLEFLTRMLMNHKELSTEEIKTGLELGILKHKNPKGCPAYIN